MILVINKSDLKINLLYLFFTFGILTANVSPADLLLHQPVIFEKAIKSPLSFYQPRVCLADKMQPFQQTTGGQSANVSYIF